jgi:Response regulator containing CheY-like receiver domain and AraC-type DNA-binding domain
MITLLIADDEKLIRAGVRKILLESLSVPLRIIEAKNGAEALELVRSERPELLVTDIRMPVMDGVELMRSVSAMDGAPAIIVLSGFDDFAYAKQAIQHGALAYILKPLDRSELVDAVGKAIVQRRQAEKASCERALKRVIEEGRIDLGEASALAGFASAFRCASVAGERCLASLDRLSRAEHYVIERRHGYLCLVIPSESMPLLLELGEAEGLSIGMSEEGKDVAALRTLRQQSQIALMSRFFAQAPACRSYSGENALQDPSAIDAEYNKLVERLDISQADEAAKAVSRFLDFDGSPEERRPAALFYAYSKITGDLFRRFPGYSDSDTYLHLKSIMIENLWQFSSLDEWRASVSDYVVYLSVLLKKGTVAYPFIEEALGYIAKNLDNNINMAIVANQVSVNYTYFSEKFKEHTGLNFNEYLKRLRIERAKSLLEEGCFKVYEVAERSGFSDVKYFMKTFKDLTGLSPGEYKARRQASPGP